MPHARHRDALLVVAAFAAGAVACTFDRRSEGFACDPGGACEGGRVCVEGWCVLAADGAGPLDGADAPSPPDASGDAFVCPAGCSRCDLDVCVIACDPTDSCATPIVCPADQTCRIECNGRNSCGGGIDCTQAASCRIQCIANDTCDAPIVCGPGACRVECTGSSSCIAGVDCSTSCQCDTFCAGPSSCLPTPPVCPGTAQCMNGIDCTSGPGPCRSCL